MDGSPPRDAIRRKHSDQDTVFDLAALPDELLELIVARAIPVRSPLLLQSDRLRASIGLALSCKRIFNMFTKEWRSLLPATSKSDGLRLTAEQVMKVPVEQLREWAVVAGVSRQPGKRRRWQKPVQLTVERLRLLVRAECCTTLPRWMRSFFRDMAVERVEWISVTEAQKKWRLSQLELLPLTITETGGGHRVKLVDVVAQARVKFGGNDAAFLDRSKKVKASKADLVKARTAEARGALEKWSADGLTWAQHAPAFRKFVLFGQAPTPNIIAAQLVRQQRREVVEVVLKIDGYDPDLVNRHVLRRWWEVSWWETKAAGESFDKTWAAFMAEQSSRARRAQQLERVMAQVGAPEGAVAAIKSDLGYYLQPQYMAFWDDVARNEWSDKRLKRHVKESVERWQKANGSGAAAGGGGGGAGRGEGGGGAKKAAAVASKMAVAGWGMLKPM